MTTADPPVPAAVHARRAEHHNVRRQWRRDRLAGALWPVPTLFGTAALLVAVVTIVLDDSFNLNVKTDHFLVGDTATALTLTSVVATGMLAFLGVVFATTLVAIQLAASQYSPRAVRVFIRSRLTKVSLGVFVATFVFSLVTLIATRSASARDHAFTPVLSTTGVAILVIATLVAFLVFANGTARLLRVQYLVQRIADEARPAFLAAFPISGVVTVTEPAPAATATAIVAPAHGVLDAIDVGGLATLGGERRAWFELVVPAGSYVGRGSVVAIAHSEEPLDGAVQERVLRCLLLTNERTLLQDPGFGLRQLVDIASRALSPAVNDPTTGVQVVDRVTDLLGQIIERPDPSDWYTDDDDVPRVHAHAPTFDELLTLGLAEIIRYGSDTPQVVRRVRAALDELDHRSGGRHAAGIAAMRALLDATVAELSPQSFRTLGAMPDGRGLG